MKKLLLLLVVIMFASCEKEEEQWQAETWNLHIINDKAMDIDFEIRKYNYTVREFDTLNFTVKTGQDTTIDYRHVAEECCTSHQSRITIPIKYSFPYEIAPGVFSNHSVDYDEKAKYGESTLLHLK
tara:strand:+ start:2473 stop:2850 length:378 start_codon:yes stop_codon:yes gene_type:complete